MNSKKIRLNLHSAGLRSNYLSFVEVLAQSIAAITPSAMPLVVLPLVFALSGNATWLVYSCATIAIAFVCFNLNQFTRRSASSGSLYRAVELGLGQTAGFLTGWLLMLCYILTGVISAGGFVNYAQVLLILLNIQVAPLVLYGLVIGVAAWIAYRDIKLSAVLLLMIEAVSIGLIVLLAIVILFQHPMWIDPRQLSLQQTSVNGIGAGMVLAILSFVGFESAATLGDEAKRPLQTIPRAIVGSTILSGLFFVGIAYLVVLGFGNLSVSLAQSDAPISVLADRSRVGWIGTAVAIGVMIAGFAATIAGINATARIVFSLAQQRMIPGWLGRTHAQNHTPHRAILSVSTIVFFFCSVLLQSGIRPLDILAYSGTLLSNGFLIIYLVIALSAPVYLRRLGQLRVKDLLISGLGVIAMLVPLASSLYPIPPAPYDSFPYLLMLWLVVGLGCWRFRRKNND